MHCGYVPFCLIKKLTKGSNTNKDQFIKCLSQMKIQDNVSAVEEDELEDFQAFTKKWLTITNRSGLFCINDGVYLFFLELELKIDNFYQV